MQHYPIPPRSPQAKYHRKNPAKYHRKPHNPFNTPSGQLYFPSSQVPQYPTYYPSNPLYVYSTPASLSYAMYMTQPHLI